MVAAEEEEEEEEEEAAASAKKKGGSGNGLGVDLAASHAHQPASRSSLKGARERPAGEGGRAGGVGLYWPEVGDKLEAKKDLGALGWWWCHGICTALDNPNKMFQMRVTHDVWWKGSRMVHQHDEVPKT